MVEVLDEDIAEALRLGWPMSVITAGEVRSGHWSAVMAFARTIAKLRVAESALEPFARAQQIVADCRADGSISMVLNYPQGAAETFNLAALQAAQEALTAIRSEA